MKFKLLSRGIVAILSIAAFSCTQEINLSEKSIVLQPDAEKGKDASIHDLNLAGSGSYQSLLASAWSWNSQTGVVRILIDFRLDTIPANAIIEEAHLSLYAATNPAEQHSKRDGTNAAYIQRITEAWDEANVNWENQPASSEDYQMLLPESELAGQDYLNIDVRTLVQYMVMNPQSSHGFLIKLAEESPYRQLGFASSDHADASKHPKLEVKYLY